MESVRWWVMAGAAALALYYVSQGLPRLTATDAYYRPVGQVVDVQGGWFSRVRDVKEVSLNTGQSTSVLFRQSGNRTSMTGLSFSNSSSAKKRYCLAVQTQHGRNSITAELQAGQRISQSNFCWLGRNARVVITNKSRPQVIRYRYITATRNQGIKSGVSDTICDDCDTMQTFQAVSDRGGIRAVGMRSLLAAAFFSTIAFVAWIGIPTFVGHLYDIGRRVLPSQRAARVKEAYTQSKTTGDTFQTETTHGYNKRAENPFRQQQDTDDLKDIAAKMREDTARMKREEAAIRKRSEAKTRKQQELNDEYEAAVRRVKELQEKLAKKGKE